MPSVSGQIGRLEGLLEGLTAAVAESRAEQGRRIGSLEQSVKEGHQNHDNEFSKVWAEIQRHHDHSQQQLADLAKALADHQIKCHKASPENPGGENGRERLKRHATQYGIPIGGGVTIIELFRWVVTHLRLS